MSEDASLVEELQRWDEHQEILMEVLSDMELSPQDFNSWSREVARLRQRRRLLSLARLGDLRSLGRQATAMAQDGSLTPKAALAAQARLARRFAERFRKPAGAAAGDSRSARRRGSA